MGAVGGSSFHFLKGLYNSPEGDRLLGASQAVCVNAPHVGRSFAVWGGLFSTFDCSMVYLHQIEDPWNSIFACAATGVFLSLRQGMAASARSAAFGGVLLALIEGAGIMLNKFLSAQQGFRYFFQEKNKVKKKMAEHPRYQGTIERERMCGLGLLSLTGSIILNSGQLSAVVAQLQELLKGVDEVEISTGGYDPRIIAALVF